MKFALLLLAGCLGLSACAFDSVGLGADDREPIELTPGRESRVDDAFRIVFTRVVHDTRCPVDVVCPWAGNAVVEVGLRMGMGPTHPFELNLLEEPHSVVFAGYEVTFVGLSPEQRTDRVIRPDQYRARIRVVRPAP